MAQEAKRSGGFSDELIQEIIDESLNLDEDAHMLKLERLNKLVNLAMPIQVFGSENLPKAPCLVVSNHSAQAMDILVLSPTLSLQGGRVFRGMSDRVLYRNKHLRHFMLKNGGIMGDPTVGKAIFAAGKDIFLCPGGAHEAMKGIKDRYRLLWKKRSGFVRLAVSSGVPIVPVGIVGPDEWFGQYIERDDLGDSIVGKLLKLAGVPEEAFGTDRIPAIPKGLFGTLLPKPEKVYLQVGKPISTANHKGKVLTDAQTLKIRELAKARVEVSISAMLLKQAQERESKGLLRKILTM